MSSSVGTVSEDAGRDAAEPPVVEIVIVSYGSRELVRACLASIARNGTPRGRILTHVVDNASDGGTVELVRDHFPNVRCRPLRANTGFSVANNVVLAQATAPYVFVLNPDAALRAGVLDHLLEVQSAQPDIGMIARPRSRRSDRWTPATGCTWRISTGATGSTMGGSIAASRPGSTHRWISSSTQRSASSSASPSW